MLDLVEGGSSWYDVESLAKGDGLDCTRVQTTIQCVITTMVVYIYSIYLCTYVKFYFH